MVLSLIACPLVALLPFAPPTEKVRAARAVLTYEIEILRARTRIRDVYFVLTGRAITAHEERTLTALVPKTFHPNEPGPVVLGLEYKALTPLTGHRYEVLARPTSPGQKPVIYRYVLNMAMGHDQIMSRTVAKQQDRWNRPSLTAKPRKQRLFTAC